MKLLLTLQDIHSLANIYFKLTKLLKLLMGNTLSLVTSNFPRLIHLVILCVKPDVIRNGKKSVLGGTKTKK